MSDPLQSGERVYKGIPVSAGVCRGKLLVLRQPALEIPRYDVAESDLAAQVQRLQQALLETRQQILEVQRQVSQALNAKDASIFDAHLLVLEDPTLIDSVTNSIYQKKINVEAAFHEFAEKYQATLSAIDDAYLRERAADMRDVTSRIMDNLLGHRPQHDPAAAQEPCILIAEDLPPSDGRSAKPQKHPRLRHRRRAAKPPTAPSWPARSNCPPWSVCKAASKKTPERRRRALLDGYNGLDHRQSHRPDPLRIRPVGPPPGLAGGKTARNATAAGRHAGRKTNPPLGQHRTNRRHRGRQVPRRRGRRACSAPNTCSSTATPCRPRRSNIQAYRQRRGRRSSPQPGHHPHPRFGRRQIPVPPATFPWR